MGSSPTAGAVTITFSGTPHEVLWTISEFSNVDTSGTNGSGAIVQAITGSSNSVTSFTITLGAFQSSTNATYGLTQGFTCCGAPITQGSGFIQIVNQGSNVRQVAQYKLSADTTVDWTSTGNTDWHAHEYEHHRRLDRRQNRPSAQF